MPTVKIKKKYIKIFRYNNTAPVVVGRGDTNLYNNVCTYCCCYFFFFFYYSLLLCYYTYYYYYYIGICMTVVRKNRTNEKYKYKPYFYRFWIPSSHRRRLAAVFLCNREGSGARRGFHGHNGTAVIVQSGVTIFFFFLLQTWNIWKKAWPCYSRQNNNNNKI